jgi:hypothetical protein
MEPSHVIRWLLEHGLAGGLGAVLGALVGLWIIDPAPIALTETLSDYMNDAAPGLLIGGIIGTAVGQGLWSTFKPSK